MALAAQHAEGILLLALGILLTVSYRRDPLVSATRIVRIRTPIMLIQPSGTDRCKLQRWPVLASKVTILLLLLTVAGLATFAKNGQYYPDSNPAQHISVSIKLNVTHSPVQVAEEPLQPVSRFLPPQPPVPSSQVKLEEASPTPPIGITVSMQHRSPPSVFSCPFSLTAVDHSTN